MDLAWNRVEEFLPSLVEASSLAFSQFSEHVEMFQAPRAFYFLNKGREPWVRCRGPHLRVKFIYRNCLPNGINSL